MDLRRLARVSLVVAVPLMATGCAPSLSGSSFGPGLHLGLNLGKAPSLSISPATCLLLGSATGNSSASAAAAAGAMRQQAAQIQAQHSLGANSPTARLESSRRLASGGC